MAQPYPSVLAGRYSALEGGWQSNGGNYGNLPRIPSPTAYSNLAAWYDVSDSSSLLAGGGAAITDGAGVALIADKSGNSATNCLCLPGTNNNNASVPDSAALSITGDIDVRVNVALDSWTTTQDVINKDNVGASREWGFIMNTGKPGFIWWDSGGTLRQVNASNSYGFSNFATRWIRATLDVDNGSGGHTVSFFSSTDGTSWTLLETGNAGAFTTSIRDQSSPVYIGGRPGGSLYLTGRVYRAQIYSGIAGTLALDANFALASKLATSFIESSSNAATVTINTSGDFGARVSGERDLVQLTAASRPIYTAATGTSRAYLTFDGTNDCVRSALFSQSQPVSRYTVARQVSWTSGDYLWDGASAANTGALIQTNASPQVNINAGSSVAANTDWTIGSDAVVVGVLNGASSALRINRGTATTGNAGAASQNGITIGASGASTAANFGNIRFMERWSFTVADDTDVQNRKIQSLAAKWDIAV